MRQLNCLGILNNWIKEYIPKWDGLKSRKILKRFEKRVVFLAYVRKKLYLCTQNACITKQTQQWTISNN